MSGSRILRRALVLGGLCVVVAAVGSVGWAMTSANEKFVACAKKKGGALRLVTAAKDCRKTERAVTWNQQGPRGLPGQRGVAGEDGEDGLDGEDGIDGDDGDDGLDGDDGDDAEVSWRYLITHGVAVAAGTPTVTAGTCAAPTPNVVNGGVMPATLPAAASVTASAPVSTGPTPFTAWEVKLEGGPATVSTWVLCTGGTRLP